MVLTATRQLLLSVDGGDGDEAAAAAASSPSCGYGFLFRLFRLLVQIQKTKQDDTSSPLMETMIHYKTTKTTTCSTSVNISSSVKAQQALIRTIADSAALLCPPSLAL